MEQINWPKAQRRLPYIHYDKLCAVWEYKQRMKPKLYDI